jgi:phospholipid-binding lipoprotein MlaA
MGMQFSRARRLGSFACLVVAMSTAVPARASDEERVEKPSGRSSYAPAEACDPLFDDACGEDAGAHFPDPWERSNRGVSRFNAVFDRFVLDPITRGYKLLLPDPVERALLRVGHNLDAPAIMINDGLQLEWGDAVVTLGRFALNSTVGLAGLFDPAAAWGLPKHRSDFGQTLTLAGVPSGPYVILPVLGPTTVRDGSGILADLAMSPLLYFFLPFELGRQGGAGFAMRADAMRDLEALQKESIDYYAALRSAFYQNRQAQIWEGREHRRGDAAPADAARLERAPADDRSPPSPPSPLS